MVEANTITWMVVSLERNRGNFEDSSNSIHKVKTNCIVSLLFWSKQLCIDDVDQIIDFLDNL